MIRHVTGWVWKPGLQFNQFHENFGVISLKCGENPSPAKQTRIPSQFEQRAGQNPQNKGADRCHPQGRLEP